MKLKITVLNNSTAYIYKNNYTEVTGEQNNKSKVPFSQ